MKGVACVVVAMVDACNAATHLRSDVCMRDVPSYGTRSARGCTHGVSCANEHVVGIGGLSIAIAYASASRRNGLHPIRRPAHNGAQA